MTDTMDVIKGKIWKIRTVKDYAAAHNHLLIGKVLEIRDGFVRLQRKTCHFGKVVNGPKDIRQGPLMVRIVPWQRIEIVNELSDAFNYADARISLQANDSIVLKDEDHTYALVARDEERY